MNTSLWTSILNFNFDEPLSEYGFTTRLAKENYWTRNFTRKAILEYKEVHVPGSHFRLHGFTFLRLSM